jgi:nucleoside-diphosphate-sugar epimerase
LKILVAGASGVVARVLVPMLLRQGHNVIGFSRHNPLYESVTGVQYVTGDVFNRDELFSLVQKRSPEIVVHLLTDLKVQSSAANARIRDIGTRNLVDAAKAAGSSKIVAQSIAWAYQPGEGAATESTPFDYAASPPRKTTIDGIIHLEHAASELPSHTILRLGTLYGAGTWYDRYGSTAQTVKCGRMVANHAITNFLHIDDAATAFLQALSWPDGPVNIVDNEPASALVWLPEYARELGAPTPPINDEPDLITRPVSNQVAHNLGWRPAHPSWRGGLLL